MILQLMQLMFFGLLGLAALYMVVLLYVRSLKREALEEEWVAEGHSGSREERDAWIAPQMRAHDRFLRRVLFVLVIVLPILTVLTVFYFVNFR